LEAQTLVDMAIIYASDSASLARSIFVSSLESNPSLLSVFESEAVPAFTSLLSSTQSSGLYGLRKTAHCLSSLIYVAPPEVVRLFSNNKAFIRTLAEAYHGGLASIAHSHGGLNPVERTTKILDEWERIWLETKVAFMDSFHILMSRIIQDLTPNTAGEVFSVLSLLVDLPSQSSSTSTPFLDQSILVDYQLSYDLSNTLRSSLQQRSIHESRLEDLVSTLQSTYPSSGTKNPGALRLLLSPSGVPPTSHVTTRTITGKGKAKAEPLSTEVDPEQEVMIKQVLDILPDYSPTYIRALLEHPSFPFKANPEKVIEALLDGTAPAPEDIDTGIADDLGVTDEYRVEERQNIWDQEVMDLTKVKVGKSTYVLSILETKRR
jgi:activating signal cointegrator complex subunit 2